MSFFVSDDFDDFESITTLTLGVKKHRWLDSPLRPLDRALEAVHPTLQGMPKLDPSSGKVGSFRKFEATESKVKIDPQGPRV